MAEIPVHDEKIGVVRFENFIARRRAARSAARRLALSDGSEDPRGGDKPHGGPGRLTARDERLPDTGDRADGLAPVVAQLAFRAS